MISGHATLTAIRALPTCFGTPDPTRIFRFKWCTAGLTCTRVRAFVSILFGRSRPTAVRRLVVAINIDAINRMARRWSHAHVGKKCRETVAPTIAHADTPQPVICIAGRVGIFAAVDHATPTNVFSRPLAATIMLARMAVNHRSLRRQFASKASTRITVPGYEPLSEHDSCHSAFASTLPSCGWSLISHTLQDTPAAEYSASDVDRPRSSHSRDFIAAGA